MEEVEGRGGWTGRQLIGGVELKKGRRGVLEGPSSPGRGDRGVGEQEDDNVEKSTWMSRKRGRGSWDVEGG